MKKALIFLVVLFSFVGNSQNYGYLVETEITGHLHANGGELIIKSSVGSIGSVSSFATVSNIGNVSYDFFLIPNNFNTIDITVNNYAIMLGSFPNCDYNKSFDTNKINFNVDSYINFNGCSFKQRVYPLHIEEPNDLNSSICLTDEITLQHGYNWQYSYNGKPWVDFPSNLNTPVTTFVLLDLLGETEEKEIKFHTGYDGNYTNIISYTIIPCSPQLQSFIPQQTTCSYTDDGSFSMVLDRDIPPGKKLLASLFYEFEPDTKPDVYNFLDQKETKVLTSNGDGTYTYQWPKDTPILPGKYKVRYQTYDTITKLESPKWDSLEGEEKGFNIGNPPVISFDLLENTLKNVSCFEGKNGQVQIKAEGGDGNFEYQLNTDPWKPFLTTNTHIIDQLPKGNHTLKVQDGNKCTEQQ